MPEYPPRVTVPRQYGGFVRGYLECAEWSGLDEVQREAFARSVSPTWSREALATAYRECTQFQDDYAAELADADDYRAGHYFWLTRNRHGAGYWDGDYPDAVGKRLTDGAHAYGERYVWFDADTETLHIEG